MPDSLVNCRLGFTNTALQFENSSEEWRTRGENPRDYWFRRNVFAARMVDKHLLGRARCLDIGCASGHLCQIFHERGHDAYGIDIAPSMISTAQKRMKPLGVPEDHFRTCDGHSIPFEDASFELVSALDVLPYVESQPVYLMELHRILKVGGLALVTNTNCSSLYVKVLLVKRVFTCLHERDFWTTNRNLIRTGYWSGGLVDWSKAIQARSADALDQFFVKAGFEPVDGFDMYNLRWLDREPLARDRLGTRVARRLAWNHFGLYAKK